MNGNPMQMIIQMLRSGGNPQQMVMNMMSNNPKAKSLLNQVKQSGMTNEQFARQYAKQNNIDIDSFVNDLKNGGVNF